MRVSFDVCCDPIGTVVPLLLFFYGYGCSTDQILTGVHLQSEMLQFFRVDCITKKE